jgi:hypothetical protein
VFALEDSGKHLRPSRFRGVGPRRCDKAQPRPPVAFAAMRRNPRFAEAVSLALRFRFRLDYRLAAVEEALGATALETYLP